MKNGLSRIIIRKSERQETHAWKRKSEWGVWGIRNNNKK